MSAKTEYWAHSPIDNGEPGLLRPHLEEVGKLAQKFANPFGAGEMALAAGMLHDFGKYSPEFQNRVRGESAPAPHSVFGAKKALEQYNDPYIGRAVAWCVAGHHSGLADYGDMKAKLNAALPLPEKAPRDDGFSTPPPPQYPNLIRSPDAFSAHFLIRMVFSCLVDADRLKAERHFNPTFAEARKKRPALADLPPKLAAHLEKKTAEAKQTPVNQLRAEVLRACRGRAKSAPGFFSLSVPTGGGKTLSSLAFALEHAVQNKMARVICAIPFTSVIEQSAEAFRAALGAEAVLEHHCNYEPKNEDETSRRMTMLSAENWDAPVVATTNVQLFESLFAASASRCRKLHNLAQSVIVLDEAQSLPAALMRPCMRALDELVKNYGASVVFCTATLPDFSELLKKSGAPRPVSEIIPNLEPLHNEMRRVKIIPPAPDVFHNPESLADELAKTESVLCIVNTRRQARDVFAALRERAKRGECFHLSTWMHPNHRTRTLNEIREKLKSGAPCRVVSTTLVEAGVDLDFPAVWRSAAGLDSVAQAAGRCNREGKMETGETVVFRMEDKGRQDWMWQENGLCAEAMKAENPLAPDVVRNYFAETFRLLGDAEMDETRVLSRIKDAGRKMAFPFKTIAETFRMIKDGSLPVVVPLDGGRRVAEKLDAGEDLAQWARRAQRWSASVSRADAEKLLQNGAAERVGPDRQFIILKNPKENYDGDLGVGKMLV